MDGRALNTDFGDYSSQSFQPHLKIIEQPRQKGQRFRYECEGRYAGHIPGENSTDENKSYPTIELCNMGNAKEAIIVASCVTKDEPYRAHPHSLVGKECNKGVCTVKLKNGERIYKFQNLGIRCAKKKSVKDKLQERQQIRVDPFGNGFNHMNEPGNIDAHCVRICFQAFLPDPDANNQFRKVVTPVVTLPIFDHKTPGDMKICRVSACSGPVEGGTEIFMLTDKFQKDDVEVLFEYTSWEDKGQFGSTDVHHQVAIVFKTPRFPFQITEPCKVQMYLRRISEDYRSEPIEFTYHPNDDYGMSIKRKKRSPIFDEYPSSTTVSNDVREKLSNHISKNRREIPVSDPIVGIDFNPAPFAAFEHSTIDPSAISRDPNLASLNEDPMLSDNFFQDFHTVEQNHPSY